MERKITEEILKKTESLTVVMIGDICLDAYWTADMKKSRLSRETPHYPLPVVSERYSLGAGGNVVSNLAALNVKKVIPVSVTGDDWRGFLVRKCMAEAGISDEYVISDENRVTPCYCKPLRSGISDVVYEDPRLDFENSAPLSAVTEEKILSALEEAAEKADIIAVCDQMEYGVITAKVREKLCEIGKTKPVVADSRDRIALYENVIVKPNEIEAAAATGCNADKPEESVRALAEKNHCPAIVTYGADGSFWCDGEKTVHVPAVKVEPPVDIVGAGDTFLSAFCCAYASGVPGETALAFANAASSITVRKIGTTGTAAPNELLSACV